MPLRLILAESHEPFRKELRRVIEAYPGFEIVGEADDWPGLLSCLESLSTDLILIDIFAPNFRGIQAIIEIREINQNAKILVLTVYQEVAYMSKTLAAGAAGYLLKENVFEELPAAIESIQKGRKCVSPALERRAPKIQAETIRQPERRMVP